MARHEGYALMPAMRCSTCGLNYAMSVKTCPSCDGPTWWSQTDEPDGKPDEATPNPDEYTVGTVDARVYDPTSEIGIVQWRLQCFEADGFAPLGASALALRRDVDREMVGRMLAGGASHTQVLAILL